MIALAVALGIGWIITIGVFLTFVIRTNRQAIRTHDQMFKIVVDKVQEKKLILKELDEEKEKLNIEKMKRVHLENVIDQEVEHRLEKRVREWWPTEEAEEDFRKAEQMATKRKLIEGKRTFVPPVTEGEPSRVSSMILRRPPRLDGT